MSPDRETSCSTGRTIRARWRNFTPEELANRHATIGENNRRGNHYGPGPRCLQIGRHLVPLGVQSAHAGEISHLKNWQTGMLQSGKITEEVPTMAQDQDVSRSGDILFHWAYNPRTLEKFHT